jgi:hypothetical protein
MESREHAPTPNSLATTSHNANLCTCNPHVQALGLTARPTTHHRFTDSKGLRQFRASERHRGATVSSFAFAQLRLDNLFTAVTGCGRTVHALLILFRRMVSVAAMQTVRLTAGGTHPRHGADSPITCNGLFSCSYPFHVFDVQCTSKMGSLCNEIVEQNAACATQRRAHSVTHDCAGF